MDILREILDRVSNVDGVSNNLLEQIEQDVRRDLGGDRYYLAKAGEKTHDEASIRNRAIKTDYRHGESVALLERRYKLSRRRIYQILNSPV